MSLESQMNPTVQNEVDMKRVMEEQRKALWTPERVRAARLQNLEKARAAKLAKQHQSNFTVIPVTLPAPIPIPISTVDTAHKEDASDDMDEEPVYNAYNMSLVDELWRSSLFRQLGAAIITSLGLALLHSTTTVFNEYMFSNNQSSTRSEKDERAVNDIYCKQSIFK